MNNPQSSSAPKRTAAGPFRARLLNGVDDPFLMAATCGNVFSSRPFLAATERHMLAGSDRLALVGVAGATGDPVAVFPFVERRKFGVPILEAVDFDIVDYFAPAYLGDAPLCAEDTAEIWKTVVKAVPGIHAVAFKKLPRQLHGVPHALSGAGFLKAMGADATTLYLRPAGRPPVNPEKMSLAREVRRKSRKLEKFGALSFGEARTNAEVDAAMAALVDFRGARFAELGRQDAMLDPRVVAFYRDMADRSADDPTGLLFTLRVGARTIAVTYGFVHGDVFTLIAAAITPCKETQADSPGLVALFKTLQWCREHGFAVFDLSVGSLTYKSRFRAETIELFEYQQALSPLGLPVVAEAALRRRVRHLALKYPQLRRILEKLARKVGTERKGESAASGEENPQSVRENAPIRVTAYAGN